MSEMGPLALSRVLRLAAGTSVTPTSELLEHMDATRILLSADRELPGAVQTLTVLATTLRRMPGGLILNPTGLKGSEVDVVVAAVDAIDPERSVIVTSHPPVFPYVHVHIGPQAPPVAARAIPHRHGGHLLVDPDVSPPRPTDVSGLGIVFTASIAAAEVFKTLAAVAPTRQRSPGHISFCPVTLGPDPERAPLVTSLNVNLALVGVGAIGTAVALILSLLPLWGQLLVVDPQTFQPENLGTYSLGTLADTVAQPQKTALAQRVLPTWTVTPFDEPVADLVSAVDAGSMQWPGVVLAALDTAESRHDTQLLWPDLIIDAGTGDTSVGVQELRPTGPCEYCAFPTHRDGPSAVVRLAETTGLDPAYLAFDGVLDADVVESLSAVQRDRLRPLVGTRRCALAGALGLTELEAAGFQPAVPFVAQQAACLAAGRLVAYLTQLDAPVTQFQYDVLLGPDLAHADRLAPRSNCYCQQNPDRIERVRAARRQSAGDVGR